MQSNQPGMHCDPQLPPLHVAYELGGTAHALSQLPQLLTSACVLTQSPLHSVVPLGQLETQAPFEQTSPEAQAVPQAPQLLPLVCRFTQTPPHRSRPPVHVFVQTPFSQLAVAFGGGAGHPRPQPPQFDRSLAKLTQAPLHLS